MSAVPRAWLLPAAVALLASSILGDSAAADKPRAERPTYSLGEKWVRDDGAYELVRIENDVYVFAVGPGKEIRLTKDLFVTRVQKGGFSDEFDPPLRLSWPLEVGKRGVSSTLWMNPVTFAEDRRGLRFSIGWSVDAYEDVHTPAGTFKAFRISIRIVSPRSNRQWELQTWYAPEARQLVKARGSDLALWTFQVVAIDRPVAAPLEVVVDEPRNEARVTTNGVVVTGKVTGGKGVATVTVTLNDREVSKQEERTKPRSEVGLSLPIQLQEGRNVLLVTAQDPEGTTRQEARVIFYDRPPSPVARMEPTPSPGVAAPEPSAKAAPRPVPPEPPATTARSAGAAGQPFQMAISSPPDQTRVDQESIALAGVVSGGKGVSRVVVALNGMEVSRLEEPAPRRAMALNVPLKLRVGPNTLVVTSTEVDGTIHQEVRTVHYERVMPLAVAFRYPEDRARVSEEASVVAAVVTSSKGVVKVSVTLNGMEVHQQSERMPQKSMLVTVPLTLREGANAIAVSAAEADGTIHQEVRTVVYDKPKTTAAVPAPAAPAPPLTRDRWAVVVGVGEHEDRAIPRLRYTVSDAEAIYQALIGAAGFKKEHVLLLTDKTERKPTLRNLKWALGTFLARSAKKEDTVLIFFAGHGAPEVDQRGIERDGLAKYLIPSDADSDDLFATALPMDDIQTIFGRLEADRVVVFLDACYSGGAGGRTFAAKKTRTGKVDDLFLERLTRAKGRAIITASRPAEVSVELPELGHGIFTYYLLQGLKGLADLNRDGIVSLQELYEYVEQQVVQKSRAVGANQHPVMKGELEGVLPLVKVAR